MTIDIPKRAKVVRVDSEYDGAEDAWSDSYHIRTPKGHYQKLRRTPPDTDDGILQWFGSMKVTHVAVSGGWHAVTKSKLYTIKEFAKVLKHLNREVAA